MRRFLLAAMASLNLMAQQYYVPLWNPATAGFDYLKLDQFKFTTGGCPEYKNCPGTVNLVSTSPVQEGVLFAHKDTTGKIVVDPVTLTNQYTIVDLGGKKVLALATRPTAPRILKPEPGCGPNLVRMPTGDSSGIWRLFRRAAGGPAGRISVEMGDYTQRNVMNDEIPGCPNGGYWDFSSRPLAATDVIWADAESTVTGTWISIPVNP